MQIKSLKIEKLYGIYNYTIDFNKDISFIYGENGCGKTTILNILGAIITGKIYTLFDYEFKLIRLDCFNGEFIDIILDKGDIKIKYIENMNERIDIIRKIDLDDKNKRNEEEIYFEYLFSYKSLHIIKQKFNYIYLPLSRNYQLKEEYHSEDGELRGRVLSYRYSNTMIYRENEISMKQISELIKEKMNQVNFRLEILNNQFRNDVLKSFSKIYNIKNPLESLKEMFIHKRETMIFATNIKEKYLKILEELDILNNDNISEYQSFFDEFIDDLALDKNRTMNIENNLSMMVKHQELMRLNEVIELANDIQMKKIKVKKTLDDFMKIVNDFLSVSSIKKELKVAPNGSVYLSLENGRRIKLDALSSGEKQIMIMFAYLILELKSNKPGIMIVDEPEMSLHLYWQHIFVDMILKAVPNVQIIFATHAPEIVSKRRDKMIKLERNMDVM